MTFLEVVGLLLAGAGAGLVGSIAGLASIISYPTLLAIGLSPVSANVTNTVALVFSGVGSTLGARPELRRQRHRVRALGTAGLLGGLAGSGLLLVTPASTFARLVPALIGLSSIAVLLPRPRAQPVGPARDRAPVIAAVFAISCYGGYFGAAAGVMLLALLLATTAETLPESNAIKNLTLLLANLFAAVVFAVVAPVHWLLALPLAVGFFLGGLVSPALVRRLPTRPLRVVISLAGLVIAVKLAIQAY